MDFIRMIDYIRPRFFVMENVKGIVETERGFFEDSRKRG